MSGGGRVPYHLRINKAVDRFVFIDVLTRVHGYRSISKHTYVGFGGPFLEDFRVVHNSFGLEKLVSLEEDGDVLIRQKFNLPLSRIKRLPIKSGDFVSTYNITGNSIIWFDYTRPGDRRVQIQEMQLLLPKMQPGDIFKITVNANPATLGGVELPATQRIEKRMEAVKEALGGYIPATLADTDVSGVKGFAKLLTGAILRGAREALKNLPCLTSVPITAFRYSDGPHQMLTVTMILLNDSERADFWSKTGLKTGAKRWALLIPESEEPIAIEVPALSVKERLFVDARLPGQAPNRIHRALGFRCGADDDESLEMIESYAKFFRHLPFFSRIVP